MENQVIEEKKSYNKFYILGIGIFLFLLLIFSMFIPGFIVEGEEESINVTLSQLIFNDHNVIGILSFVFLIISLVVVFPAESDTVYVNSYSPALSFGAVPLTTTLSVISPS